MTSSAATSRLDRARRLAFALRVFGRRPSAANLRAALHRQRVLRLEGREAPVAVVLGLTYRCQCACEHCSVEAGPGRQRDDELSTAKLEDLLRQIRALGALKVSFFGGEPLLHPDVHHLASLGAALGLRISIDTNGILLDQGCVDALVRSRVSNVNISIDSPDPAEHDRLRRHPGAFQAALAGLPIRPWAPRTKPCSARSSTPATATSRTRSRTSRMALCAAPRSTGASSTSPLRESFSPAQRCPCASPTCARSPWAKPSPACGPTRLSPTTAASAP